MMILAFALPLLLVGLMVTDGDDGADEAEAFEGTPGDDTMTGSTGNELLRGNGGDDLLQGLDGDDTLFGNAGDDALIGDGGDDMLCSGIGDDVVTGSRGEDPIEGQEGNDWVSGDYSNDLVYGNDGEDTVLGGRGLDVLGGGNGNDVLFGGIITGVPLEADQMEDLSNGGSLADILAEDGFGINMRDDLRDDEIYGGVGDDTMFVGGLDNAYGGLGADTFNVMADHTSTMNIANIQDYNAADDNVGVVVNDGDEDMEITVSDDGGDALVMGDGVVLARVMGAAGTLSAASISVLSESSVASMFDPNA